MNPTTILYIVLAISAMSYLFDQALDYLNLKAQRKDIPDEIASFYDKEKYIKSLDYHREQTRFSFITSAFSFVISFSMLLFGGFGWVDAMLRPYFDNEIVLALGFFGVIIISSDILTLPFQWHSTFGIEEKYGFNKTTVKTFVTDKLKGYLLGGLIGGTLLALLIFSINWIGPNFWVWFGILAAVFILFINMFYTTLLLPLFNKLTPLG
ncbi:MAG: M48 family peptidase, partial [Cyclobacteriaceae bacterium]|nr:M48 family peptidase [Cyclobacteriaceae bacterium]